MSSYNPRERPLRGDKTLNAIVRCGQAVHLSIERFVTLGEAMADDNAEIKVDMYEACRDARAAVVQQPMRAKAYCAHLSIRGHWALRRMSRCPDHVVSLKQKPQCLVLKKAWYSFIDPLKG
ncbi:alpha-catulin [Trichonephila clavipes]|nr:alpha-catulin [Trichonephila clavipes]